MVITGSARIYSIYTSQAVFNGQVLVKISTDGKFLIIGTLNFADNNISISGRLYADLSQVTSGSVTVLFLADIPDQVRLLTLYGKLKMGFKNSSGQEVVFTVPQETATSGGGKPTGSVADPSRAAARSTSTSSPRARQHRRHHQALHRPHLHHRSGRLPRLEADPGLDLHVHADRRRHPRPPRAAPP